MQTITKIFTFDSAHRLPWHQGKCYNTHGHRYTLEVKIQGELNENGIIMDFSELKEIVNKEVIEKYDHKLLNDLFENPTAELMAKKIFENLFKIFRKKSENYSLMSIKLYETPDSYTEVTLDDSHRNLL